MKRHPSHTPRHRRQPERDLISALAPSGGAALVLATAGVAVAGPAQATTSLTSAHHNTSHAARAHQGSAVAATTQAAATPAVGTSSAAAQDAPADSSKSTVFNAPFSDGEQWGQNSTAFPMDTSMGYAADHKLDHVSSAISHPNGNNFGATKSGRVWNAQLATTENTNGGFKVRTGDSVEATITLNNAQGAWPALWTWNPNQPGYGEVDLFEYHSTHPNMLEFWNKVGGGNNFADNMIQPGTPFNLRVDLNADGIVWYVNGKQVYKGNGLPADWNAYLIANLSVADGSMYPHAAPGDDQSSMNGMTVDSLQVKR